MPFLVAVSLSRRYRSPSTPDVRQVSADGFILGNRHVHENQATALRSPHAVCSSAVLVLREATVSRFLLLHGDRKTPAAKTMNKYLIKGLLERRSR